MFIIAFFYGIIAMYKLIFERVMIVKKTRLTFIIIFTLIAMAIYIDKVEATGKCIYEGTHNGNDYKITMKVAQHTGDAATGSQAQV